MTALSQDPLFRLINAADRFSAEADTSKKRKPGLNLL
jgi:hypothetical protein